jgi:hypothetical protein
MLWNEIEQFTYELNKIFDIDVALKIRENHNVSWYIGELKATFDANYA